MDAMGDDERTDFVAEQRSRERLQSIIRGALAGGEVEVYACWAGDEATPPDGTHTVNIDWLTTRTQPLRERMRYIIANANVVPR